MKKIYCQRVKNPRFRKMYLRRKPEMTPKQHKVLISDLQLIVDILKYISMAGFVAFFLHDDNSLLTIVIAFWAALLTFPLRRSILNREEELNKNKESKICR